MPPLDGRRILVVGASSGIGRATAVAAARAGAHVGLAARRRPNLDAAALDCGPTAYAFAVDVTDDDSIATMLTDAVAHLGDLDTLVYAAGISQLGPVATTTAEEWHTLLSTNLVGAARTIAYALPHLRVQDRGCVALLSSHSVGDPWPGLVPYAATKAALDELILGLRSEEPDLRVLRIVVGNTATGFADGWDPVAADAALRTWLDRGLLRHKILEPDHVAERIIQALASDGPDDINIIGEPEPPR